MDDKLLRAVKANFAAQQPRLVALILDTTATAAVACPGSVDRHNLVAGDVAFSLLQEVRHIPLFEVYGIQWDAYDYGCPYPSGLLRYVAENRATIWLKTAKYLTVTAPTAPH